VNSVEVHFFIMEILSDLSPTAFIRLNNVYGRIPALGRILALVECAECKTIIVEENPQEKEFRAEFESHYKNVLSLEEKKHPKRLHFFKNIKTLENISDNDPDYLGYCDIRPTTPHTISCALIDHKIFSKPNKYIYLVCKRNFTVPFGSKNLSVEAFPYIQQDGSIIRCAQASLASISMYYDKDITGPDFTTISEEAIPTGHRPIPSGGMTSSQIGFGWSKLDKDQVMYSWTSEEDEQRHLQHREQLIYRYLESGIPVLIGINAGRERHALVVIGHTFTPDSWIAQTKTSYYELQKTGFNYHCSTNWVERFIVQDDNLGPYTLVLSEFLGNFGCDMITVGLPKNIFCKPEDVEVFAGDLLCPREHNIVNKVFDLYIEKHCHTGGAFHDETAFWYNEFKYHTMCEDLVLRTYLKESDKWKDEIKKTPGYNECKDLLENLPLPKYLWVTEISWPQIFRHGRKLCGEIVFDTTSQVHPGVPALDQCWLWMHVPGIVLWRNAQNNKKGTRVLQCEDPIRQHRFNE